MAQDTAHTCTCRAAEGQERTNTLWVGRTGATQPTHQASGRGGTPTVAQVRHAKVQAVEAQMKEAGMVQAIEGVQSVLMQDWSNDYANSDHWLKY